MKNRFTPEYEAMLREMVNMKYVDQRGTESYERATLLAVIDDLREQLAARDAEIQSLKDEIAELRKDVLANAKDAERYRFVDKSENLCFGKWNPFGGYWVPTNADEIDAAIARQGEK